jgi:thymidylate kinase
MIIIIEGPDGSGKSTLAETLSKQTSYPIIHRSKPENDEEKQAMLKMYVDTIRNNKNAIFDRCWYSELAYGPVMRDTSVLTYQQMYDLERMVAKVGGIVVYCADTRSAMWARAHRRGEDHIISRDSFNEICENYDGLFSMPHLIPVTRYSLRADDR